MDLLWKLLILISIIIIFIVIFCFVKHNKKNKTPKLHREEGNFLWLYPDMWNTPPITPYSNNTLLGTPMFEGDRHNPSLDTLPYLYGGKLIGDKQVWVIRGVSCKVLKYWSYSLFKLGKKSMTSVGYSINNEIIKDSRNGDELVLIVSPNYKLAEAVANEIHQKDYRTKLSDDRHVIFRYFPIMNYDASAKYTFLYEAAQNGGGGSPPKITVARYSYTLVEGKVDPYPFFPVEKGKDIQSIVEDTVDENKTLGDDCKIFDRQIEKQIGRYQSKHISTFCPIHHADYIYTDSGPIDVIVGNTLITGVLDHSSTGKCLYSELIHIDDITGNIYDNHNIGNYDPSSIDINGKIKLFITVIPIGITRVRVYEKIIVDLSTKIKPDPETIITARTYVTN